MQYSDFYELKEIGSGGYGTVYTARYKGEVKYISQMLHSNGLRVLMKTPELFNKFRNHAKCSINFLLQERDFCITSAAS